MNRKLSSDEVIALLKQKQGERSLRAFALELGLSAAYLSDVYLGKREPGPSLLDVLGLIRQVERKVVYVRNTRQERKTRRVGKNAVA